MQPISNDLPSGEGMTPANATASAAASKEENALVLALHHTAPDGPGSLESHSAVQVAVYSYVETRKANGAAPEVVRASVKRLAADLLRNTAWPSATPERGSCLLPDRAVVHRPALSS